MEVTSTRRTKDFEPINFNIRIESESELKILWNLFNRSANSVQKQSTESFGTHPVVIEDGIGSVLSKLFNVVDKRMKL